MRTSSRSLKRQGGEFHCSTSYQGPSYYVASVKPLQTTKSCGPKTNASHVYTLPLESALETSPFPLPPQTKIPGIFCDHHHKYLFLSMSKIQYHAVTDPLSTLDCGICALGQLHNAKVYEFGLLFGLVGKQKSPKSPKEFCANVSI